MVKCSLYTFFIKKNIKNRKNAEKNNIFFLFFSACSNRI